MNTLFIALVAAIPMVAKTDWVMKINLAAFHASRQWLLLGIGVFITRYRDGSSSKVQSCWFG